MTTTTATPPAEFCHLDLANGVEFAAELLPQRQTVAICCRLLTGLADEPPELTGINGIVERTLSKGTRRFDGRGLADAFDALGASWSSASGRQSTLVRVVCLPEFTLAALDLVGEMVCHPTFPDDACRVAIDLAQQELRRMEDEPDELLRALIQRLTLGPVLGRHPGGEPETLGRLTPDLVRAHWQRCYHAGRMQIAAAGPVVPERLAAHIEQTFAGLGSSERAGRAPAAVEFQPQRVHRQKELEQQYIGITLPGLAREDPGFVVEQVALRVLSGGMSGRLFTEVREKLGLVYWVGAWHEQPRGHGVIHLGASTTPERCHQTFEKLLTELARLAEDLTAEEVTRARDGLIAHYETESDLTRARAGGLSDDLFHHGRPIGLGPKLAAIRAVTREHVADYAGRLPRDRLCVATLGPRAVLSPSAEG
jgi:predicted Zn-dependent peptidase